MHKLDITRRMPPQRVAQAQFRDSHKESHERLVEEGKLLISSCSGDIDVVPVIPCLHLGTVLLESRGGSRAPKERCRQVRAAQRNAPDNSHWLELVMVKFLHRAVYPLLHQSWRRACISPPVWIWIRLHGRIHLQAQPLLRAQAIGVQLLLRGSPEFH